MGKTFPKTAGPFFFPFSLAKSLGFGLLGVFLLFYTFNEQQY